jgi:hypothetical protein
LEVDQNLLLIRLILPIPSTMMALRMLRLNKDNNTIIQQMYCYACTGILATWFIFVGQWTSI